MQIPSLDSFDFNNKTVLVRLDLNSPYDAKKKKIHDDERIMQAPKTIRELVKRRAKVVILAHQGRLGDEDCVSLAQHADLLEKHLGMEIRFVQDTVGEKAKSAIKSLDRSQVLMLENVRFLRDETDEKKALAGESTIVKELSPLANIFVNDAFSVSHRAQASVVGFCKTLPSCFGRLMEKELKAVAKALHEEKNSVLVLGGAKSDECLDILEHNFSQRPQNIYRVLTCGVTGNIFMKAKGIEIGKKSEELIWNKDMFILVNRAARLLQAHKDKILVPSDVAIESGKKRKEVLVGKVPENSGILDVGSRTIKDYNKIIMKAKTVIVKGPAGMYEDARFRKGTKSIFDCVAESKAYSVMGGGDTTEALDELKINKKKISHISLAGGALIEYLCGKSLPGIEAVMKGKR